MPIRIEYSKDKKGVVLLHEGEVTGLTIDGNMETVR
jgi:hypothetical protein